MCDSVDLMSFAQIDSFHEGQSLPFLAGWITKCGRSHVAMSLYSYGKYGEDLGRPGGPLSRGRADFFQHGTSRKPPNCWKKTSCKVSGSIWFCPEISSCELHIRQNMVAFLVRYPNYWAFHPTQMYIYIL